MRIYLIQPNWFKKQVFWKQKLYPKYRAPSIWKPIVKTFYINSLPANARSVTRYTFLTSLGSDSSFTLADLLKQKVLETLTHEQTQDNAEALPETRLSRRQRRLFKIVEVEGRESERSRSPPNPISPKGAFSYASNWNLDDYVDRHTNRRYDD